jgi:hypothetical protein
MPITERIPTARSIRSRSEKSNKDPKTTHEFVCPYWGIWNTEAVQVENFRKNPKALTQRTVQRSMRI